MSINGKQLGFGGLVFTLAGLIFTAGYQWRLVSDHLGDDTPHSGAVPATAFQQHIENQARERSELLAKLNVVQAQLCIIQKELEIKSAHCP